MEDSGLTHQQAMPMAQKAVQRYPDFAPFYLLLGDRQRDSPDTSAAIATYRKGLELVEEPDLESRLLCALAGTLPKESPERKTLIERALGLQGSLVAQAMARLMAIV